MSFDWIFHIELALVNGMSFNLPGDIPFFVMLTVLMSLPQIGDTTDSVPHIDAIEEEKEILLDEEDFVEYKVSCKTYSRRFTDAGA